MNAATVSSCALGRVAGISACPVCGARLSFIDAAFRCNACGILYPIRNGVVDLRPESCNGSSEEADWSEHWSSEKQQSLSQRFFSAYRKAVFARTVRYFIERYFPVKGILVEAGSGTSETSMLVPKAGRTLVAVDLIAPVLERCHPVMDVRIAGNIFHLPFLTGSLDGIWNVGVMEHFTHDRIDEIMTELHRALKPGARVVLLWPAVFSLPQRILRVVEFFLNLRSRAVRFRFHPDEISQLRSIRQGREVLVRNGFRPIAIDPGFRSLMAFETLVGEKL